MRVAVHIYLREGILDPQGDTIADALAGMGYQGVGSVRQGKILLLELGETDPARAIASVDSMCRKLLANPVTETYTIGLVPANGHDPASPAAASPAVPVTGENPGADSCDAP